MKVAVPSMAPGGIEAPLSGHFGHCDAFTLLEVEDGTVTDIKILPNEGPRAGWLHGPGNAAQERRWSTYCWPAAMGARPLAGFPAGGH